MPSKYEITKNAAQWLKTEVLSTQPNYLSFLRTAAQNFKYDFVEQLLIHEQKPDATACAGIDHLTAPREKQIRVFFKNSFAFGGINASLICKLNV